MCRLPNAPNPIDDRRLEVLINCLSDSLLPLRERSWAHAIRQKGNAAVHEATGEFDFRFFYNHKNLSRGDETTFVEIFPYFHRIMLSCHSDIDSLLGARMNTSATKVADNAIVGYVLAKLKPQVGKQ